MPVETGLFVSQAKEVIKLTKERSFDDLVKMMGLLRSQDGCPWDREQTHQSLKPYLIEETYEVIDAIDHNNTPRLKEELGDLLLQVVFQAQIAAEDGKFTINDIVEAILTKLEKRHPHVFAGLKVGSAGDVVKNWEKIKQTERQSLLLEHIPSSLPALIYAYRLQEKTARVGFDWQNETEVFGKVEEELKELKEAQSASREKQAVKEEIGDIIFSLVNLARHLDVEPEEALKKVARKFFTRFGYIEKRARKQNKNLEELTLEEMDKLWEEAKHNG